MGKTVKMSFEGENQQESGKWTNIDYFEKKREENGPRASSAPALGLNTLIFKHVIGICSRSQVSVYRTIGPLVLFWLQNNDCGYALEPFR